MSDNRVYGLEALLGLTKQGARSIDHEALTRNVRMVLRQRNKAASDLHFAALNALTLLDTCHLPAQIYDELDRILASYILSSRSESDANYMLMDLLAEHWPLNRAVKLTKLVLLKCRYRHRVEALLRVASRNRTREAFVADVTAMCQELQSSSKPRARVLASELLRILKHSPEDRLRPIRIPTLEPRKIELAFEREARRLDDLDKKLRE